MPKYEVIFKATDLHIYIVEADSEEKAEDKAQKLVDEHEAPDRIADGDLELDSEVTQEL